MPPPGRREIFRHFTDTSNERKRKVTFDAARDAAEARRDVRGAKSATSASPSRASSD
jgi:hypothetical protein